MAADTSASIDDSKLDELRDILEDDGLNELIGEFFDICNTDLENLNKAITDNNVDDIFRLSHGLKSSSGNLGFIRMSDLCRTLELQARNNELSEPSQQAHSIVNEFNYLKEIFV